MPVKVEFRQKGENCEVFVDGHSAHWTCDAVVLSLVVSDPIRRIPYQLTVVKRAHDSFGVQSAIVFDGRKPKEDDWFSGELFGSIEPTETGVTVWSTKNAQLEYSWPA